MNNNLAKHFEISNLLLKFQTNPGDKHNLYKELKALIESTATDTEDELHKILSNIKAKYSIITST